MYCSMSISPYFYFSNNNKFNKNKFSRCLNFRDAVEADPTTNSAKCNRILHQPGSYLSTYNLSSTTIALRLISSGSIARTALSGCGLSWIHSLELLVLIPLTDTAFSSQTVVWSLASIIWAICEARLSEASWLRQMPTFLHSADSHLWLGLTARTCTAARLCSRITPKWRTRPHSKRSQRILLRKNWEYRITRGFGAHLRIGPRGIMKDTLSVAKGITNWCIWNR